MSQATTITLANQLSLNVCDATQLTSYYTDVVYELGRNELHADSYGTSLTGAAYIAVTQATGVYTWPATAIRPLLQFYDDTQLADASPDEAYLYDENWRHLQGVPVAIVTYGEDQRTFSLVPVPAISGQTVGGNTPFTTWVPENVVIIYTENRADVHLEEELPMALEILSREFARDSDHQDMEGADLAQTLSKLFWRMVAS